MSLISTARALDDQRFLWRVNAAALVTAADKVDDADGVDQWFAEYVVDHPMQDQPTIAGLVASNVAIAANVAVDAYNTVNTEAVTDSDILYVVGQVWHTAALRYDELKNPVN